MPAALHTLICALLLDGQTLNFLSQGRESAEPADDPCIRKEAVCVLLLCRSYVSDRMSDADSTP